MYFEAFAFICLYIFLYGQQVDWYFSLYNNIHQPSKLNVGSDFHCFKNKIEPKWEDPICANGGKWTISCGKGKSDTFWLHTVSIFLHYYFCMIIFLVKFHPNSHSTNVLFSYWHWLVNNSTMVMKFVELLLAFVGSRKEWLSGLKMLPMKLHRYDF